MPTGVYTRTPEMKAKAAEALAKGRLPEARAKAAKKMKELAKTESWRQKMSEAARRSFADPTIKARHLRGVRNYVKKNGTNFKGGNGKPPVAFVAALTEEMRRNGFIPEYVIKTKGHGTGLNCPRRYIVDFGNADKKIAYEIDGPSHRRIENKQLDAKKQRVLEALGWTIIRIKH